MNQLEGDVNHARTAASMLAMMPGNSFLYYEEELGATERRAMMPWSGEGMSVESAQAGENGLYSYYKEILNLKKDNEVLRTGDIDEYNTGDQGIVSFVRMTESQSVLVLINLTGETKELDLEPSEKYGEFTKILFRSSDDTQSSLEGSHAKIQPYSMLVLE